MKKMLFAALLAAALLAGCGSPTPAQDSSDGGEVSGNVQLPETPEELPEEGEPPAQQEDPDTPVTNEPGAKDPSETTTPPTGSQGVQTSASGSPGTQDAQDAPNAPPAAGTNESEPKEEPKSEENPAQQEATTMTMTVGGKQYTVALEQNEAAAALAAQLPLRLDMSELNGNEKYVYLPFTLPTNSVSPGSIEAGDVMLYGKDCLVVFYQSFSTGYSYTRIGHITDPSGLQEAVGRGGVEIGFSK